MNGVVKWFDSKKGYGFLRSRETEGDIFVHGSAVTPLASRRVLLCEGDAVLFDIESVPKKPGRRRACHVVILNPDPCKTLKN